MRLSLLQALLVLPLLFTTLGCDGSSSGSSSEGASAAQFSRGVGEGSGSGPLNPGPGTGQPQPFNPGTPTPTPSPTATPPGALPVAVDDAYAIETGRVLLQTVVTGVTSNDTLEGATVVFPTTTAQGGTLTGQADGSFEYEPPTGFTGSDSFEYTLTNSEGSATATVALVVRPRVFRLVSVNTSGTPAGGSSGASGTAISSDGTLVVFTSQASNLVAGDTNGAQDIFLANTVAGTVELISKRPDGTPLTAPSTFPDITPDGNIVVFSSSADDIVPGDTNGADDVFLVDRVAGTTEIVSLDSGGSQHTMDSEFPHISGDGRYVVYTLAGIVSTVQLRDRQLGTTTTISESTTGGAPDRSVFGADISGDGLWVAMTSRASNLVLGDTNDVNDVPV